MRSQQIGRTKPLHVSLSSTLCVRRVPTNASRWSDLGCENCYSSEKIHGKRRRLTKLLDFDQIRWIRSGGFNRFTFKKRDLDPASSRCYAKRRPPNFSIRLSFSFKTNFLLLRLVSRRRTWMIRSSRLPPCFLSGQRFFISSKGEVFSTANDFG